MITIYEFVSEEEPKGEVKTEVKPRHSSIMDYIAHPMYKTGGDKDNLTDIILINSGFKTSEKPSWQYEYVSQTEEIYVDLTGKGDIMYRKGPTLCWGTHEKSVSKFNTFLERRGSAFRLKV